jgi:hypothetical protein
MVIESKQFNQWFTETEIHEVIENRSDLLVEYIHDAQTGNSTIEIVHSRITDMLQEAYLLGKNNV